MRSSGICVLLAIACVLVAAAGCARAVPATERPVQSVPTYAAFGPVHPIVGLMDRIGADTTSDASGKASTHWIITVRRKSQAAGNDFLLTDSTALIINGRRVAGTASQKEAALNQENAVGAGTAVALQYQDSSQTPLAHDSAAPHHLPIAVSIQAATSR
jgi:hypothetical protein